MRKVPTLDYESAGPVASSFLRDDSFVRGLRGPFGSGKSVTCCIEIGRRAMQQAPWEGVRKTKWGVIRNTYSQLKMTTVQTWRNWFTDDWGHFKWTIPFTHELRFQMPDGTIVEADVTFLALDQPKDIQRLLSLDVTGIWVNEAREVSKAVIDAATGRCRRYPEKRFGGPTWTGLIMDTNSPDESHWWPVMSGDVPVPDYITADERLTLIKPRNWRFFSQPPAMLEQRSPQGQLEGYVINPERENKAGVDDAYYEELIQGKAKSWIDVYVLNRYGTISDGKPVYPMWRDEMHRAAKPLEFLPDVEITMGFDFGRSPACVLSQVLPGGRWQVVHEIIGQDMSLVSFAPLVKREIAKLGLSEFRFRCYGDPSGDNRSSEVSEHTAFSILRAHGVTAVPANTNDPTLRIEAVTNCLNRLVEGIPALLVSPKCINLIQGFRAGYHYKRLQVSGLEQYQPMPDKNRFSHVHDALQYAMIGGGEGRRVLTNDGPAKKATQVQKAADPFQRASPRFRRTGRAGGYSRIDFITPYKSKPPQGG